MTADVDVVNYAVRALGGSRITGLDDGSKVANAASDVYALTRDQVLRSHNWNFATSRAALALLGDAPAFGFDYQHALPADWIKTVSVHDNDAGLGAVEFKEETYSGQRVILSNSNTIYLRYISRVEDPNLYTADFIVSFAVELAMRLAWAVPNSSTIKADLEKEVTRLVTGAKSRDSQGQTPERRPAGSWVTSRHGWPSARWPR